MNREHDELTHVIEAWLDTTEPIEDPAAVLDRVIDRLDVMPQRRPSWLGRGSPIMSLSVRIALAAAAAFAIGVAAISLVPANPQPGGDPSPSSSATPVTDLGVFEPVRGRIVYRAGNHLEAVDPDDPASPVAIKPVVTSPWAMPPLAMPAGWSADGSKLAITDEDRGGLYVMDQTGSLARVPIEDLPDELPASAPACCWFVPSAWLSPDGAKGLVFASPPQGDPGTLYILDLDDVGRSRAVAVETFAWTTEGVFQAPMPVWSPDGRQVAYIWSKGGGMATPAVGIIDLGSGVSRELISDWGLIRQLAWSPDGSQLLVVAGPTPPTYVGSLNPLSDPQPTSLYRVDIDDGEAHEVASGHYVAAAWSPDGDRIAAVDYTGRYHRVVVVNADGSGERQVLAELSDNGDFTGVVWHPVPAR